MLSTAFYVTGGTLPPEAPSYVRREADDTLFRALLQGEYCYVFNARQMGKSSLCVRTLTRLQEEGFHTAFLDLTRFGSRNLTAEQWYAALLAELGRELGCRGELLAFWKAHPQLPPVHRLFQALTEAALPTLSGPVVVFVDEIDVTRSLPFSTDEFFGAIRQLYVGRVTEPELGRVRFCLLGTATPEDLIHDTRVSPFNVGRRIELRDFTPAEAAPLTAGLGPCGLRLMQRVLYWTGGHPYLTQRLCRAVQEAASECRKPECVDRLCRELFLTHSAQEADDNLALVRNRLLKSEVDLASLLTLYERVRTGRKVMYDETNPLCAVLKLSGVAAEVDGRLKVRNRIYAEVFDPEWVRQHMPDAEVRRQRAAYRRGLLRATSGAGVVLAAMVALMAVAVQQKALSEARLVQMHVAAGNRLVDEGDLLGALPWFAEALRLDEGNREREAIHRMRIGTTLAQCPRLLQVWFHGQEVTSVAFSRDGRLVAAASKGGTARIWEVASGKPVSPPLEHRAAVNRASFSPDGRLVVTASDDGTGQLWETTTGLRIGPPLRHAKRVSHAEFSPDGGRVLTASSDATARIWDAATGQALLPPLKQSEAIAQAAFSPNGRQVVTVGGAARLWDARTARARALLIPAGAPGGYPSFSADGRRVALAFDQEGGLVFDTATGRLCLPRLHHYPFYVRTAAFSPNGRTILTTAAGNGTAHVWDAHTGHLVAPLRHTHNEVLAAIYSPDGSRVVTTSGDGTVRFWDAQSGVPVLVPLPHPARVEQIAFSPDGRYLATAATDGTTRVWNLAVQEAPRRPHETRPFLLSAPSTPQSRDGRWLLRRSGSDMVQVYAAAAGRPGIPPLPHFAPVSSARFSPDGRRVATILEDGTAQIWEVATGRRGPPPLRQNARVVCAEFSGDGSRVVTASVEGAAQMWDSATGEAVGPPLRHRGSVENARFDRSGGCVATSSWDNTARVWDGATGEPITPPLRHAGWVLDVEFSADGGQLFTLEQGQGVWVWDLPRYDRPVQEIRQLAGVLSGQQIDPGLGARPLGVADLRRAWDELRTAFPSGPVPAPHSGLREAPGPAAAWPARWEAGGRSEEGGLTLCDGNDGEVEFSSRGGHLCAGNRSGSAMLSLYLYFRAAPPPPSGSLYVTVEYYDQDAREPLHLDYDSRNREGGVYEGSYTSAEEVAGGHRLGTHTWRRAIFRLKQPRFGRRQNLGSDFRLAHGPMWIRRVEVSPVRPADWNTLLRSLVVDFSKAIAARPEDRQLYLHRGELSARLGEWRGAEADFTRAIQLDPHDASTWLSLAHAQLGQGNTQGYRRTCARMLAHFGDTPNPGALNWVAWTCALAPGAVSDPTRPVRLARKAGAAEVERNFLNTHGAVLYRAGRYEEAIRTLRQVAPGSAGETAFNFFFLAMAYQRHGQGQEARKWLDRAVRWTEESAPQSWAQQLELRLFRREAEALIQGSR